MEQQCLANKYQLVTEKLNNSEDGPMNHLHIEKLNANGNSTSKNISIFKLYSKNHTEVPKNYSENPLHRDINHSTSPPKQISLESRHNETYENNNNNVSNNLAIVEKTFNKVHNQTKRRIPVRKRQDNSGVSTASDVSTSTSEDSASTSEDSASINEDSSSTTEDSTSSDDEDSEDDKTDTNAASWPANTWTEVLVLFSKDVKPDMPNDVEGSNVFQLISKALEHNRQAELEMLKLKERLKKLKLHHNGGLGSDHSDVNININAASPLGINADVRDRHSSYARSPSMLQIANGSPYLYDQAINDDMLEDEKRRFIRREGQFLRDAWLRYRMRQHQMFVRSAEDKQNHLNGSTVPKVMKMSDYEKQEYIRKGVEFLRKAWNQYKLKKYHQLKNSSDITSNSKPRQKSN
ncbi:hypothetical protein JTE90_014048 [Oedothorax gibbosus]|uniref:Uncharacterized protein n=1 Tax=Oedothorax gibbosus TaxID=931172 RepID=A0AAV6V3W0_9ARAC|nr:hypothetical protein JTE90_014048 [Oedothorax gibbosus]